MERDFYMSAQDAVVYGLADKIMEPRNNGKNKKD
jgi:ATP-dependent protease ClpP protease subunit